MGSACHFGIKLPLLKEKRGGATKRPACRCERSQDDFVRITKCNLKHLNILILVKKLKYADYIYECIKTKQHAISFNDTPREETRSGGVDKVRCRLAAGPAKGSMVKGPWFHIQRKVLFMSQEFKDVDGANLQISSILDENMSSLNAHKSAINGKTTELRGNVQFQGGAAQAFTAAFNALEEASNRLFQKLGVYSQETKSTGSTSEQADIDEAQSYKNLGLDSLMGGGSSAV